MRQCEASALGKSIQPEARRSAYLDHARPLPRHTPLRLRGRFATARRGERPVDLLTSFSSPTQRPHAAVDHDHELQGSRPSRPTGVNRVAHTRHERLHFPRRHKSLRNDADSNRPDRARLIEDCIAEAYRPNKCRSRVTLAPVNPKAVHRRRMYRALCVDQLDNHRALSESILNLQLDVSQFTLPPARRRRVRCERSSSGVAWRFSSDLIDCLSA